MKFYTKDSSNIVFTIKSGSNTIGLIEVKDLAEALESKGLAWIDQAKNNSAEFATVLEPAVDCADNRISKIIDICHVDHLSDDCSECIAIF